MYNRGGMNNNVVRLKRRKIMHDYKKRYLELFNEITEIIEKLIQVQQKAEQAIISDENNDEEE
jgi:hypothetical protein